MSGRGKPKKKRDAFAPGGRMYEKFKDQNKKGRRGRGAPRRKNENDDSDSEDNSSDEEVGEEKGVENKQEKK